MNQLFMLRQSVIMCRLLDRVKESSDFDMVEIGALGRRTDPYWAHPAWSGLLQDSMRRANENTV